MAAVTMEKRLWCELPFIFLFENQTVSVAAVVQPPHLTRQATPLNARVHAKWKQLFVAYCRKSTYIFEALPFKYMIPYKLYSHYSWF